MARTMLAFILRGRVDPAFLPGRTLSRFLMRWAVLRAKYHWTERRERPEFFKKSRRRQTFQPAAKPAAGPLVCEGRWQLVFTKHVVTGADRLDAFLHFTGPRGDWCGDPKSGKQIRLKEGNYEVSKTELILITKVTFPISFSIPWIGMLLGSILLNCNNQYCIFPE